MSWKLLGVLTITGDLPVLFVTGIVVELGVRVVEDGPALIVLHSITVTLVMHLAAPTDLTREIFKQTDKTFSCCIISIKQ